MTKSWHFWFCTTLFTILFSLFATTVVCYLSLIVPVSPWIDPTLALLSLGCVLSMGRWWRPVDLSDSLLIATATGSIGGMVGTAVSWSLPTLHFLDAPSFQSWIATPWSCVGAIALLVLSMGGLGMLAARFFMYTVDNHTLRFPIAQVVAQTIAVREQVSQAVLLVAGMFSAVLFHLMQALTSWVPHVWTLMQSARLGWWQIPKITLYLDFVPMLWAIGSVTGSVIALPFLVGIIVKLLFVEPCYRVWFTSCLTESNFFLAFCTGLVMYGVISSFTSLFFAKRRKQAADLPLLQRLARWFVVLLSARRQAIGEYVAMGVLCLWVLYALVKLSFVGSLYVLIATLICSYQLILLMGRIGLAPLGRFAVFVLMPGLLLFGYTPLQVTIVAACIEIAGGVAASVSSGMRAMQLGNVYVQHHRLLRAMQWLALCVSAITVGCVFWILARYVGIGSDGLMASRAQVRALMVRADTVHIGVMALGAFWAWLLHQAGVNATLVLGGLVMPIDWSLILIVSGFATRFTQRWGDLSSFWSGLLASSSLWMILRSLFMIYR